MKPRIVLLTLALILLTVFATAFAMINYTNSVKVWPLLSYQPLTLVIGLSFLLGASVSALLIVLLNHARPHLMPPMAQEEIPKESVLL